LSPSGYCVPQAVQMKAGMGDSGAALDVWTAGGPGEIAAQTAFRWASLRWNSASSA
jgi:hypothetical protein